MKTHYFAATDNLDIIEELKFQVDFEADNISNLKNLVSTDSEEGEVFKFYKVTIEEVTP